MGKGIAGASDYPEGPIEKIGSVFVPLTQQEVKKRIARAFLGTCEVEGCNGRAVAYHAACMWRLCANHAAQHAKRTKG